MFKVLWLLRRRSPNARYGIMASGKSYEDTRQALRELGVTPEVAARIGLRLYKIGMPWPLEPEGIRHFSEGLEEVLIVEERREIIENQIKQQLFNWRADVRPHVLGKFNEVEDDYSGGEWMPVDLGTCEKMGGKLEAFEGTGSAPKAVTGG